MQGSIYNNKGRYWWRVKFPGQTKYQHVALKPEGARFATKDKAVAVEVAKMLWQKAATKTEADIKTISDLTGAYHEYCKTYYQHSQEAGNIKYALDFLDENTDVAYAQDFDSIALQKVRDKMIETNWTRKVVNKRIVMLRRLFKWAAAQKLVPVATYQSVATVENLKAGRSTARESKRVVPVPESIVNTTLTYMSPVGQAMVKLQLLTGMRSTELCNIRPKDIETTGRIWLYRPKEHKTAYRGHKRIIYIGPKAQKILKPFLKRNVADYCFTPAESYKRTKLNQPCYDRNSYRQMINHAIKKANRDKKGIPHWHPHQLRHTAGTKIRKELGRDTARAFLGHRNPAVTDDYAEIDFTLGEKAARILG